MLPIKGDFAMTVVGPSASGKSTFVQDLLNNGHIFERKFDKIFWFLGDLNAKPKNLNIEVEYLTEFPEEFVNNSGKPVLYVLDDAMLLTENNKAFIDLLTKKVHHNSISVIFITHNYYHKSRYSRDANLNTKYLVIMNNPVDRNQISYISKQFCGCPSALSKVYKEIISENPYSYLFVDLHQGTHELLRFRSDILNPNYLTVFCPSNIPAEINGERVENENCAEGQAYSICFKRCQL